MPADASVAFAALVTPAQVAQAWQSGAAVDAEAPDVAQLCEAVSAEIEGYLDRRLIVHVAEAPATGWAKVLPGYRLYLGAWPMLGAPSGWTAYGQEVRADRLPGVPVTYFAGYRRADMGTLADVQAEHPALAVLPPLLPADIATLAADYVLYLLNARAAGVGQARTEVQAGSGTVTRTGTRAAWWAENRRRIDHHRRITL